jgi:hypothetical protein
VNLSHEALRIHFLLRVSICLNKGTLMTRTLHPQSRLSKRVSQRVGKSSVEHLIDLKLVNYWPEIFGTSQYSTSGDLNRSVSFISSADIFWAQTVRLQRWIRVGSVLRLLTKCSRCNNCDMNDHNRSKNAFRRKTQIARAIRVQRKDTRPALWWGKDEGDGTQDWGKSPMKVEVFYLSFISSWVLAFWDQREAISARNHTALRRHPWSRLVCIE